MRMRKVDYELLARFRRELRHFLAFSEQAAQAVGLSAQQYQALLAIKGHAGRQMTVGELAGELLVAQHSASELADRMVEKGLLTRLADARDRRRTLLVMTPAAESLFTRLVGTHIDELRRVQPSLVDVLTRLGRQIADTSARPPDPA